jgi:hypothetical protein
MSDDSSSNPVVDRSGGVDIHAQTVNIYGDVTGRDRIDAGGSSTQLHYDSRERYIEQIIRYHRDLDFVGIPELKDRQALHLEDVFIQLQAEIEIEMPAFPPSSPPFEELDITTLPELENIHWIEFNDLELSESVIPHFERSRLTHLTIKRRLSVNEALRDYPYMVILGDPGAGKTTLLKYLALAFASGHSDKLNLNEARLPVFVRVYDYGAKRAERQVDYSLVDYLYTQAYENLQVRLENGFFENELERGQCRVCLDGLDELGSAGLRRRGRDHLARACPRPVGAQI